MEQVRKDVVRSFMVRLQTRKSNYSVCEVRVRIKDGLRDGSQCGFTRCVVF